MQQYSQAYLGSSAHGQYAARPLPPYLEEAGLSEEDGILDVCYHLLQLYCDRSHPLHSLLNPTTATPHHLDHRLR